MSAKKKKSDIKKQILKLKIRLLIQLPGANLNMQIMIN